jgi:hypothetical protein
VSPGWASAQRRLGLRQPPLGPEELSVGDHRHRAHLGGARRRRVPARAGPHEARGARRRALGRARPPRRRGAAWPSRRRPGRTSASRPSLASAPGVPPGRWRPPSAPGGALPLGRTLGRLLDATGPEPRGRGLARSARRGPADERAAVARPLRSPSLAAGRAQEQRSPAAPRRRRGAGSAAAAAAARSKTGGTAGPPSGGTTTPRRSGWRRLGVTRPRVGRDRRVGRRRGVLARGRRVLGRGLSVGRLDDAGVGLARVLAAPASGWPARPAADVWRACVRLPCVRLPDVRLTDVRLPDVRLPDVRLPTSGWPASAPGSFTQVPGVASVELQCCPAGQRLSEPRQPSKQVGGASHSAGRCPRAAVGSVSSRRKVWSDMQAGLSAPRTLQKLAFESLHSRQAPAKHARRVG